MPEPVKGDVRVGPSETGFERADAMMIRIAIEGAEVRLPFEGA